MQVRDSDPGIGHAICEPCADDGRTLQLWLRLTCVSGITRRGHRKAVHVEGPVGCECSDKGKRRLLRAGLRR